ncbi:MULTISPECIES: DUF3047 domain-containing protein [unclassified Paracoccus (in: a-proteobacteria)]|uniref:DUF3047 domain-containing protein n=1 Tax=unclassified Paracoccus (in: a-proteobacteria) TaxID=2688777 RepID=UPI001FFE2BD2|nr:MULTISPECIES: DUF3047 domain-containing protein [unclassified Paracoccus (in: a-proteobacteria)]
MQRRSFLATAAAMCAIGGASVADAQQATRIAFDNAWRAVNFPRLSPTRYGLGGGTLSIAGDASSSLIYRAVPDAARGARTAQWDWSVTQTVPPTDLARKGGDDRNISVYFVFMPRQAAGRLSPDTSPQRLLSNRSARTLIYVWGGSHRERAMIASPYLRGRGFTIALRPAGTGTGRAQVDLASDHAAAFGTEPELLVGLAVSADSDDTDSQLRASVSNLILG